MISRNPPRPTMPRWGSRLSGRDLVVYAATARGAAKVFCAFFGRAVTTKDIKSVYELPPEEKLVVDDPEGHVVTRRHPFALTSPCGLCPFRSDIPPYLRPARVREIERSLKRASFDCHETTGVKSRKSGRGGRVFCAGALILMEKFGRMGRSMWLGRVLRLYDPSKLDMRAPVFDSFDAMARAQEGA